MAGLRGSLLHCGAIKLHLAIVDENGPADRYVERTLDEQTAHRSHRPLRMDGCQVHTSAAGEAAQEV
jgi:hypothetical protein